MTHPESQLDQSDLEMIDKHPGIPQESSSLLEAAYNQILLQIVRGSLPSGTVLKTTKLSDELGLSRTPIVQALQRLIADGIVTQIPQQRAVVAEGADRWLVDIHEMRLLLEPHAVLQATNRLDSEMLDLLSEYGKAAEPTEQPHWIQPARAFDYLLHTSIARASGNLPLCESIRKCMSFKRLTYEISEDAPELLQRDYEEHLKILEALKKRQPETASAAMLFHLRSSVEFRKPGGNIF
ncbi:GntR family transcriptional regulator [uncultured Gimesia sp.]|uniref:GntR family transcriptional regulator n=1 Tax=uncultured Gimesia sp. TaxID=1678688 RepID=UPI0026273432|nr:GntR family transcriptional regulator [uncultured Gimesia sp.]